MSLAKAVPVSSDRVLADVPLARVPTTIARVRSHAAREIVARLLPRTVLFAHGPRNDKRRRVALTFDDGPDDMTSKYLQVLDDLGVRATFFLIGENIARGPDAAHEYMRRGHEVGGHGWSHLPFSELDEASLANELARMRFVLPACGKGRVMVRPPRGALSVRALMHLARSGCTTVLWSVDSDDCRTRDARIIERRLAPERISPGDVVLMHELQPWTLEALPTVVGAWRRHGFELATVSELMGTQRGE